MRCETHSSALQENRCSHQCRMFYDFNCTKLEPSEVDSGDLYRHLPAMVKEGIRFPGIAKSSYRYWPIQCELERSARTIVYHARIFDPDFDIYLLTL